MIEVRNLTVTIDGVDAFENADVSRRTAFIRDTLDVPAHGRVGRVLCLAGRLRSSWDAEYAGRLLDTFGLDPRKRISALSRGQRSRRVTVTGRPRPSTRSSPPC
jgi:ABC-2 type transport system ATP-binding protein